MVLRLLRHLVVGFVRWVLGACSPRPVPPGTSSGCLPSSLGAPADAVWITYAPRPDGAPDPGEVVWTWVPYEDNPSQGKDRPVLLVGRRGASLVGVPFTSTCREGAARVPLGAGPWDRAGRESYARIDRLLDVAPTAIRREGSVLDRVRFDRVVAALRELHGARIQDGSMHPGTAPAARGIPGAAW